MVQTTQEYRVKFINWKEITDHNERAHHHYFDQSTMKCFSSRLLDSPIRIGRHGLFCESYVSTSVYGRNQRWYRINYYCFDEGTDYNAHVAHLVYFSQHRKMAVAYDGLIKCFQEMESQSNLHRLDTVLWGDFHHEHYAYCGTPFIDAIKKMVSDPQLYLSSFLNEVRRTNQT